jgi:hypothetical protein
MKNFLKRKLNLNELKYFYNHYFEILLGTSNIKWNYGCTLKKELKIQRAI